MVRTKNNCSHVAPAICLTWVHTEVQKWWRELDRVIITIPSDRYRETLVFGEQDPFRGGVQGQRKGLWVRKGFTEKLAVLMMNGAPPGGGSMGSKGNSGESTGKGLREPQVMEKNMCKVQRLQTSR